MSLRLVPTPLPSHQEFLARRIAATRDPALVRLIVPMLEDGASEDAFVARLERASDLDRPSGALPADTAARLLGEFVAWLEDQETAAGWG